MLDGDVSLCSLANRFLNNRSGADLRGPPAIFCHGGQLLLSLVMGWWVDTRVKASA